MTRRARHSGRGANNDDDGFAVICVGICITVCAIWSYTTGAIWHWIPGFMAVAAVLGVVKMLKGR